MLTKEENINLVIYALKLAGWSSSLIADGVIGEEAKKAVNRFTALSKLTQLHDPKSSQVNPVLLALKAGGFNDNIVADGFVGEQAVIGATAFLNLQ